MREGVSLANAMADPESFSELYVHMVRAGNRPAHETVLDRLADYGESQAELVRKVRGALTYPGIPDVLVGTAIMGFLVTYVIPQLSTIFSQTDQALPITTQVLVGFSNFLIDYCG